MNTAIRADDHSNIVVVDDDEIDWEQLLLHPIDSSIDDSEHRAASHISTMCSATICYVL